MVKLCSRKPMMQASPQRRWLSARRDLLTGLAFISPWLVGFAAFTVYPVFQSLYYSFTNFDLLQPPAWIGVGNYTTALSADPRFWTAVQNTVLYSAISVPVNLLLGLLLALMLSPRIPGRAVLRTIFFLPSVLPLAATTVVWGWTLDPQYGYIDTALRAIGVSTPPGWFADPAWTKFSFVLMGTWSIGPQMVIFLAALQLVPKQLYEAATVEGAGTLRRLWHVTLPMISPAILFNAVIGLITSAQLFTQPFILEGGENSVLFGGPLQSALFYAPFIWQNAFSFLKAGYAAALAWLMFLTTLVIVSGLMMASRRLVYYAE